MEEETITLTVAGEWEGTRLDSYLAEMLPLSRSYIQKLIKNEKIRFNGNFITKAKVPVRSSHTASAGKSGDFAGKYGFGHSV